MPSPMPQNENPVAPPPVGAETATYAGNEPCRRAKDSPTVVGRACRQGGIPEAKREMKRLLRQARASGLRTDCDACHTDTSDYGRLTGDAKKKFEELLATIGGR